MAVSSKSPQRASSANGRSDMKADMKADMQNGNASPGMRRRSKELQQYGALRTISEWALG